MKQAIVSILLVFALYVALEQVCRAGCQFDLTVKNTSSGEIKVTKISTSTAALGNVVPIYKEQWDGNESIAAASSHTFTFTVDSCPSNKSRSTKVFYTKAGGATKPGYQDVEYHASGEVQEVQ